MYDDDDNFCLRENVRASYKKKEINPINLIKKQ